MTAEDIALEIVANDLPKDLALLQSEAKAEGYLFIERLADEWAASEARFDRPGESLLIARCQGQLAGIGGITIDPFDTAALRMRRFYVRPAFRRSGVARMLAGALISRALETGRVLTVNAGTDVAPPFWERMGFIPVDAEHHTHIWPSER
ncbi:MAG: GNAT family N-acetyltransferase [Pseudomonadota bacterium]